MLFLTINTNKIPQKLFYRKNCWRQCFLKWNFISTRLSWLKGAMIERFTQTLKQQNKIISINDIITNWRVRFTVRFYCVSGWHGRPVGVMVSCLRFLINSKKYTDKLIILLLHGRLVWPTPPTLGGSGLTHREPSISYDVYVSIYL